MRIDSFLYLYPEKPVLVPPRTILIDRLSEDPRFIAEKKYNGSRLLLHFIDNDWRFFNRHGKEFRFVPDMDLGIALAKLALKLHGYWLFDGELRNNKVPGVKQKMILWDVFIMENILLQGPFWHRRRHLEALLETEAEPLGVTKQYPDQFRGVFSDVIQDKEIEGLVMKNLDGTLNLSRTSNQDSAWQFKIRRPNNSYRY